MPYEKDVKAGENQVKNTPKLSEKQTGYILLRKQGMSIADAAKATGYNQTYAYRLEKKVNSYDLTDDFWLSEATKALKKIITGKTFGDIKEIKASTSLEAAKMVFDRHQPVVRRQENLNLNVDLDLVDLSKYRRDNGHNLDTTRPAEVVHPDKP